MKLDLRWKDHKLQQRVVVKRMTLIEKGYQMYEKMVDKVEWVDIIVDPK